MLCLDFALLITDETNDIELPWPLKRGAVEHVDLRRNDVTARVPWLAPNTLRLRSTKRGVMRSARWRHADGTLTRPMTKWGNGNELDVSLVDRPADARLIVRLLLREVPMRPRGTSGAAYR